MIILDNSILSAFKRINALNLIREFFEEVVVPTKVYEEFVEKWGQLEVPAWVRVETLSNELSEKVRRIKLGFGEAQAIVLAERKNVFLHWTIEKLEKKPPKGEWISSEAPGSSGLLMNTAP